jgi:streptomycin 3"-kinase
MGPMTYSNLLPAGDWSVVGRGESDTEVFSRGDAFAKCAGPDGAAELRAERERIAWLASTELPGATVLDWLESADGACLVTSAVPGVTGVDLPPPAHAKATSRLAAVLRSLHDLDPTECPFVRPLEEVVAQATDVVRRGAVNPDFLNEEAWRREHPEDLLRRIQAAYPRMVALADPVVCHGDACLPNVLFDPSTLEVTGLIDLGRLGVADRYADLAVTTVQLRDEWDADPADFLTQYGIDEPDQDKLGFYLLLDPLTWG